MIIFGNRIRHEDAGKGQFNCPRCHATREYTLKRARQYFALYFIPLIPLGKGTEYVQCNTCGTQFELSVLSYQPPSADDLRLQSLRAELRGGTPLQMTRQKLVNAGVDPAKARDLVLRACSVAYRECPTCKLTYHESIDKCSSCGANLRPTMSDGL